jgi:IPP transferase
MLRQGLLQEVAQLCATDVLQRESSPGRAIGYRQAMDYLLRPDPVANDLQVGFAVHRVLLVLVDHSVYSRCIVSLFNIVLVVCLALCGVYCCAAARRRMYCTVLLCIRAVLCFAMLALRCCWYSFITLLRKRLQAFCEFFDTFTASTRRYAAGQLQWFRSSKGTLCTRCSLSAHAHTRFR